LHFTEKHHISIFCESAHLSGTVRSNRYDFPKNLASEELEKGTAVFYVNRDVPMIACKYRTSKDKASGQQKVVFMLTTSHQAEMEMFQVKEKSQVLYERIMSTWVASM